MSVTDTATGIEARTDLRPTQAGVGRGGGATMVTGGGVENTRSLTVRGCKHDRKGYCSTHEMVATKKFRDIPCLKARATLCPKIGPKVGLWMAKYAFIIISFAHS